MRRHHSLRHPGSNRRGHTLVVFALILPLLLGMVGLAIDSGLLLVTYRQTQNAADSAAFAAALDLFNNLSVATAKVTGATYVQTYNNMSGATVTINIPPLSGPHTGSSSYAEAIVSYPYKTSFIQLLGVNKVQNVTTRAVAGYHPELAEGIVALLQVPNTSVVPNVPAGVSVTGGTVLQVNGGILDNSTNSSTALSVNNGANVYAAGVSVSGTASIAAGSVVSTYPSGGGASPLTQNTGVDYSDPLGSLVVPTTSNGVVNTNYGTLSASGAPQTLSSSGSSPTAVTVANGNTATLLPGIYQSISVAGGSSVTFQPGIYVLAGGTLGAALTISNGATISGSGVMFYNTASTYNATTGSDGGGTTFGSITITGGTSLSLSGITGSSSPFNGVLVFQDRSNTKPVTLDNGSTVPVTGAFYAPAANLSISGGGTFDAPFIVGSLTATNGSTVTINAPAPPPYANLVFLVE
jgi:Flp pilus assembly protein TadG